MIHSLPPEFTNRQIKIALAGAGGNGSQMLTGLARMHVTLTALGHPGFSVCVFDPDTVSEANIGRQLFSQSDIGANKASVLVNRVNMFFNLDWNAVPSLYKAGQRFSDDKADILIGCVDSAAARRELAKTRFKYWLDLGNTDKKGQVILGTRIKPKKVPKGVPLMEIFTDENKSLSPRDHKIEYLPTYRPRLVTEIFPELNNKRLKEDTTPSCSLVEAIGRQDLFINQFIATCALQLIWQFIRQGGLDIHGYFINLETGKITPLPIRESDQGGASVPASHPRPSAKSVVKITRRKFTGKVKIGADLQGTIASLKRSKRKDLLKRIAKKKEKTIKRGCRRIAKKVRHKVAGAVQRRRSA